MMKSTLEKLKRPIKEGLSVLKKVTGVIDPTISSNYLSTQFSLN